MRSSSSSLFALTRFNVSMTFEKSGDAVRAAATLASRPVAVGGEAIAFAASLLVATGFLVEAAIAALRPIFLANGFLLAAEVPRR
jgi:hypothetical protein